MPQKCTNADCFKNARSRDNLYYMKVQMKTLQSVVPSLISVSTCWDPGWANTAEMCSWCCFLNGRRKREGRELRLGFAQPVLDQGAGGLEPPAPPLQIPPASPFSVDWANHRLSSLPSLPPSYSEDSVRAGSRGRVGRS